MVPDMDQVPMSAPTERRIDRDPVGHRFLDLGPRMPDPAPDESSHHTRKEEGYLVCPLGRYVAKEEDGKGQQAHEYHHRQGRFQEGGWTNSVVISTNHQLVNTPTVSTTTINRKSINSNGQVNFSHLLYGTSPIARPPTTTAKVGLIRFTNPLAD